jgi:hypothetical protein
VLVLSEAVLVLVLDHAETKPHFRPAKNGAQNGAGPKWGHPSVESPDFQTPNFVLVLVPAVIRASV